MNIAFWVCQVLLAIGFIGAAYVHAVRWKQTSANVQMRWLADIGHQRALVRHQYPNFVITLILGLLAAFVAYGRFVLVPL